MEPNGHDLNLVLVLEDGYDQTALDNVFIVPDTLLMRRRLASDRCSLRDLRMWSDVERYLPPVI